MADLRTFELDELANRPGTYFNPKTEMLIVVDDSSALDAEAFEVDGSEGSEWVLVSDEVPVDESRRDELLETFQVDRQTGAADELDDEPEEDEDELDGVEELDA
ncbi:MAG: hypothetical protein JOZ07_04335 [Solirubrobacterales bacterium]|nr:hypothetical protein [Solirubrobacterales bacterium]